MIGGSQTLSGTLSAWAKVGLAGCASAAAAALACFLACVLLAGSGGGAALRPNKPAHAPGPPHASTALLTRYGRPISVIAANIDQSEMYPRPHATRRGGDHMYAFKSSLGSAGSVDSAGSVGAAAGAADAAAAGLLGCGIPDGLAG
eukprot:CAMPEP_0119079588 /NCGR_PEP_ID=MMETSP1178-20130426/107950_1 /TAXON_ID=33656 /ORGANISM="unid sp, Strain CCMP2000" /LENGTH=145 /DNA_ID=CAMNT_0007062113 /DNA_START=436 /DNA_END=869 /DNA_ORIENTATION=-